MAGFVRVGETLTGWCRSRGYQQPNVRAACFGSWEGPRAREIREEILVYLAARGITL